MFGFEFHVAAETRLAVAQSFFRLLTSTATGSLGSKRSAHAKGPERAVVDALSELGDGGGAGAGDFVVGRRVADVVEVREEGDAFVEIIFANHIDQRAFRAPVIH